MLRIYFSLILIVLVICPIFGASQLLEEKPKISPGNTLSANVEWDDVGFLGRITMKIYDSDDYLKFKTTLPQIKPSPASLSWINEEWVACESILGEKGTGFFYTFIPEKKAYLIEIFAPENSQNWMINFSSSHHETTRTLPVLTSGRNALFPILLRELPKDGIDYFTPEFTLLLQDAVDAFNDWTKRNKLVKFDYLPIQDSHKSLGSICLTLWNDKPAITYFPAGTTTTREMLAETQIHFIPKEKSDPLNKWDFNNFSLKWIGESGEFVLMTNDEASSVSTIGQPFYQGKFFGISDSPYTGPTVEELIAAAYKSEKPDDQKSNVKPGMKEVSTAKKTPPAPRKVSTKKVSPVKTKTLKTKTPSRSRR